MYMYIQVQLISSVFKQYLTTCTTKRYLQSRIDDLHVNSIKLISPRYFFWTCHYWFSSEKIVVKCCHVFSDSHVFHKVIFGYLSFFFQNDVIFLIYTYNTGWADPFFELYIYICTTLVMLLAEVWLCDLWWNASPNFFFMNY